MIMIALLGARRSTRIAHLRLKIESNIKACACAARDCDRHAQRVPNDQSAGSAAYSRAGRFRLDVGSVHGSPARNQDITTIGYLLGDQAGAILVGAIVYDTSGTPEPLDTGTPALWLGAACNYGGDLADSTLTLCLP